MSRVTNGAKSYPALVDRRMTRYVLALNAYYGLIESVPGHIVELGTGPGTNAVLFGHLIHLYGHAHTRHYYGFDTFNGYPEDDLKAVPYLDADAWTHLDSNQVRAVLREHDVDDVTTLIEGDLKQSFPEFIEAELHERKSPGFLSIALLYVDCNSYPAAKTGIEHAVPHMTPGGVIAVDELRQGGETRALRELCEAHDLQMRSLDGPATWAAYTTVPGDHPEVETT